MRSSGCPFYLTPQRFGNEHLQWVVQFAVLPVAAFARTQTFRTLASAATANRTSVDGSRPERPSGREPTHDYGRRCLLARRLVEHGERFVCVVSGGGPGNMQWDAHKDIEENRLRNFRDIHATILQQLGLDQHRLTYPHLGRDERLTFLAGKVIEAIV